MKVYILLLVVIFLFSGCSKIEAETLEDVSLDESEMLESITIDRLLEMNQGNCSINNIPNTTIAREINGRFSDYSINSFRDAIIALSSVRDIMGITRMDFRLILPPEERDDIRVYSFVELYKNIEVFGSTFHLITSLDGMAISVKGAYKEVDDIPIEPSIKIEEINKYIKLGFGDRITSQYLIIYAKNDSDFCLAWKVTVNGMFAGNEYEYIIDAADGRTIAEYSVIEK